MPDITIAYVVEPRKMPALRIEGISLEPDEFTAVLLEIERSYAEISRTSSGRFIFQSNQSAKLHRFEFKYEVRQHETSGRDRSIYFHSQLDQSAQIPSAIEIRLDDISKLVERIISTEGSDLIDPKFLGELRHPAVRSAILGKSLVDALQGKIDYNTVSNFRKIVRYLSLADPNVYLIEDKILAIVKTPQRQRSGIRMIYGKKTRCCCRILRR